MPTCRYFQQGNCRFGDRCRYEHPRNQSGFSSQGQGSYGGSGGGGGGGGGSQYKWSSSNYGSQPGHGQQGQRGQGSRDQYSGRGGGDGDWGNRGSQSQGGYRGGGGGGGGGGGSWGGGGSNQGGKQVAFKDSFAGSLQGNKFGALADQGARDSRSNQPHGGSSQDVSAQEIMEGILYDMEEWEKGKMWPFSCYGPNKSKSCLSGLEDLSQEELRFLAYMAEKAKQFEQYKVACSTALSAAKNKRDQLRKPSQAMKNQLVDMYKGASDANPFAAANTTNVFGNSVPSLTDIFGVNLANIKVAPGSNSSTGTAVAIQSSTSVSVLGVPSTSSGSTTSNAVAKDSLLFNPTQGSTQGVFGNAGGTSNTVTPTFGSAPSSGASGVSSVFGSGSQSSSGGSSNAGLFGKGATTTPASVVPQQGKAESRTYTPLASLTPEEKEQFEAPVFMLGKVPTRPPPIELVR